MIHHSSAITRLQLTPPVPFGRSVLWLLLSLFFILLLWAALGRLDIVAVAEGKLVPQTYIKIVQPAEQGVVKEILVKEGEAVKQGQVLLRMDAVVSDADIKMLLNEFQRHTLALRRIDAELDGKPLAKEAADPADLYVQLLAQYNANRLAYQSALDEQRSVLEKARQDRAAAEEIKSKLTQVLPHYRDQEEAYNQLSRKGFAGKLMATDKQRERIEKEQDLKSQEFVIRSAQATIQQVQKKITQIGADYSRQLQTERVEIASQLSKVNQELAKQQHRQELLELKASQAGIVKDLATHTVGTVTAPGTVLLTLVPMEEPLQAEVWVSNEDIGFVRSQLPVKLKFSAFTFQKYGMVDGTVEQVSADASETAGQQKSMDAMSRDPPNSRLAYKTLVTLKSQKLDVDGHSYYLAPGMRVSAEIRLGTRSVLEYLLSPIQGAFHEAGRER
ncbi:MAG: HlyD family type I secretion periplasmic adaptor subunit [Methylobacter sp.]|jgi:HlyD family secretion protein|nr:HlyD family type I secretion periplasmic adaptor subunit [Methylobacter sp.]